MGGGVGLGTLGVTHGLGPEPAAPPPPRPTAPSSNTDEREEVWWRKRQVMRDWDARQRLWHTQAHIHEQIQRQYERMQADLRAQEETSARAQIEHQRLRAADVLHRFRRADEPSWLPPEQRRHYERVRAERQNEEERIARARAEFEPLVAMANLFSSTPTHPQWSTSGSTQSASDAVESRPEDQKPSEQIQIVDGVEVEQAPASDYAVVPLGDRTPIEALANGTLEVIAEPGKGIRAVIETDDGQRFMYAGIGSLSKRRVKAGEIIGYTPEARPHGAGQDDARSLSMTTGARPTGELPAGPPLDPLRDTRKPDSVEQGHKEAHHDNVMAFRSPPPTDPPTPYIWRSPPPERRRPPARNGVGVLVLLGLGVAMVATSGSKHRR